MDELYLFHSHLNVTQMSASLCTCMCVYSMCTAQRRLARLRRFIRRSFVRSGAFLVVLGLCERVSE